ncbi:hypothetical protein [Tenacibaculum sp. nBUS_03]|uniref:hypothetical protein n=1 Tax=Tenacibaculum sp. nBUS_03 TaxID=3395320 RepID=UPI003EC04F42
MKYNITLFLLFVNLICFSQSIKETELIGKWRVEKIVGNIPKMPKKNQQQKMDVLIKAFKNSTFEFKSNHIFNLNIDFPELRNMMNNTHWKFKSESYIMIQEIKYKDKDKDKYELMGIKVLRKEGGVFFTMTESPFVLKMKKN